MIYMLSLSYVRMILKTKYLCNCGSFENILFIEAQLLTYKTCVNDFNKYNNLFVPVSLKKSV